MEYVARNMKFLFNIVLANGNNDTTDVQNGCVTNNDFKQDIFYVKQT